MATGIKSFAISGIDAYVVDIEIKSMEGTPLISIIGLGDQAVKEAGERITSAVDESGYNFPKKKIIISLAPSDKKKSGSHYDLAMALGVLQDNKEIDAPNLSQYGILGELSLDGRLRGCRGILPMMIAAHKQGLKKVIIPNTNFQEANLVKNLEIYGFDTIMDVIAFLQGEKEYQHSQNVNADKKGTPQLLDFGDVRGQKDIIDAAVLAAAGGHNMLMIGEPGCGKTMIAQRLPSILPQMTEEECLEVTKIYSIAGQLENNQSLVTRRPFRAPHHNSL